MVDPVSIMEMGLKLMVPSSRTELSLHVNDATTV